MAAVAQDLTLLLDRRVAALRKAQPNLADALELQAQLIRASLTAARAPLAHPFALPREQLTERIRQGVPLLHNQPAQIDVHFAADLFSRLAEILAERDDPQLRSRLDELVAAATSGLLDP